MGSGTKGGRRRRRRRLVAEVGGIGVAVAVAVAVTVVGVPVVLRMECDWRLGMGSRPYGDVGWAVVTLRCGGERFKSSGTVLYIS